MLIDQKFWGQFLCLATIHLFPSKSVGAKTLSITTLGIMTPSIKTLGTTPPSITALSINTQHNGSIATLGITLSHTKYCYAECRSAECRYAEGLGAKLEAINFYFDVVMKNSKSKIMTKIR